MKTAATWIIIARFLIATQMVTWGWFNLKGQKLTSTRQSILFSIGMGAGNVGAGIETYLAGGAWGTFSAQIYYLAFVFWGGLQGIRAHRKLKSLSVSP